MADNKVDLHQYRFRVKTGAGQEIVSSIATVRGPVQQVIGPATPAAWVEVPVTQILIYLKGQTQGEFHADAGLADRPGTVPKHLFSTSEFFFSVHTPRDAQSGLPTGKRIYVPATFLKANGPSTPQLYQALATNEALPTVVFDCYGQAGLAHSVKLFNASVASMDFSHPDLRVAKTQGYADCTQVALTFQKIEIDHGPVSVADQW